MPPMLPSGDPPLITPLVPTSAQPLPFSFASSLRQAAHQAAQDDLTRRSDSPVANSPSKSAGSLGSASVSGGINAPTAVRIPPSPLAGRRDAVDASALSNNNNNGPGGAQGTAGGVNTGTGLTKDGTQAPTDSITLGQLKNLTAAFPKTKQSVYTFPSPPPDTSDLLSELEEFYSYVEVSQVIDHKDSFLDAWPYPTEFIKTPRATQLEHIQGLLDGLNNSDADVRFTNARHLLYIAQGSFQSSTSPEHHLHLILGNVGLLRTAGALPGIWEAIKGTGLRWEGVSTLPDPDAPHSPGSFSAQERQECLDEINGELALHLAVLYFMMEVYRGDEEWADELMALEPPMPIYLFNLVAGLREKNAKGYPVKKLLLLLWKSILACIGGMKDISRVKEFVREVEGLPPDEKGKRPEHRPYTKTAPPDFQSFRNEITSKYPSYAPPPIPLAPDLDRISAAAAPAPVRPTFSYHINANHDPTSVQNGGLPPGAPPPLQQPATPAPSPPPSPAPKPKKQQFQTDQTKPFVLPFAPANAGPKGKPRAVPHSIEEAGDLYRRNMRISNELWQTWKLREEYMADESGILRAAATLGNGGKEDANRLSRRLEALDLGSEEGRRGGGSNEEAVEDEEEEDDAGDEDDDPMDPLSMLRKMERKLRADEAKEGDEKERKKLTQRRQDVQRLERVEQLYRAVLPQMQSAVIVLLKLLLATVTANNNVNNNAGGGNPDSGNDEPIELSLEDTDIMRHREITSKAVSAILILTLKWFKTSHGMKFHYLSQLLVDSNCLLLILKMFGLQEVSASVKTKNDRADQNFFKYCHDSVNPSFSDSPRPEDIMLEAKPPGARPTSPGPNGDTDDEVELITDFSWRNFFSVINFVHILQKLTKRKTHRVLLLVQYKSSAILKRILKVSHPTLQLYVLKVIKSQVPYCGRKWRQSNMKVITAIYLHCRPDLRDEWLTGVDVDADVEESLPHEQALRSLVRFFNTKHYGSFAPHLHRRSSSAANHAPPEFGQIPPASPGLHSHGGMNGAGGDDEFPPTRSVSTFAPRDSPGLSAQMDDFGTEYDVDDLLLYPRGGGAGGEEGGEDAALEDLLFGSAQDWEKLGEMVGEYEDISDSESVGSLGGLFAGFGHHSGAQGGEEGSDSGMSDFELEAEDERRTRDEWEKISPETIIALETERAAFPPSSPRPSRRRSSTGPISPALRPVLIDHDDDQSDENTEPTMAPSEPHGGPAVDEVELVFGE